MITYEANIICDTCEDKIVTGEPAASHVEARGSAKRTAAMRGWHVTSGIHKCQDCAKKAGLHVSPNP